MAEDDTQFDALLGGKESLPPSLHLSKFVTCRSEEIQAMKNSLLVQTGNKLAFQTLPKHMRRRAMSHNVKRLPRRLRQIHLNQMKKSGMPAKLKRPSRKYRRRPRNLVEEFTKRSARVMWLQTHIWHAKRFHVVEKWGFKLPDRPCDKAFRACYRAMSQHCLLQDVSYFRCVEISGNRDLIVDSFKKIVRFSKVGLGAKAFIGGQREGELTLFEIEDIDRAIGSVSFLWQPNTLVEVAKLWLWVHPAFYETCTNTLMQCFSGTDVTVELCADLSRFRLTGPFSNAVLHDALLTSNLKVLPNFQDYISSRHHIFNSQIKHWNDLVNVSDPSAISPHCVLGLLIKDPRLQLPKKRTKSLPSSQREFYDLPKGLAESPLWNAQIRDELSRNKATDSEIANLRSNLLVPGTDLDQEVTVPIILVQRPGNKKENVGLGSGWDVIMSRVWAKTLWISFIMHGARVGGLRETNSTLFEMGRSQFLEPGTRACTEEDCSTSKEATEKYFRRPPNKRTNYNKFKIASPFTFSWNLLVREWSCNQDAEGNFSVVKDQMILNEINQFISRQFRSIPKYPSNSLLPIKLECFKKGSPSEFAILCLPKTKEDLENKLIEPMCRDELQDQRKLLRQSHKTLLKQLRKQRKKRLKLQDHKLQEMLRNYTKKMRSLWLPEPTAIRKSCCREVVGFVTKGGFSFSTGKCCATGYIVSDCVPSLLPFRNRLLVRNTNSRQYYAAKLSLILE